MLILTDGIEIFGEGETKPQAIDDAIAHCPPQGASGEPLQPVTAEWIAEQIAIGEASEYRHGLFFETQD